MFCTRKGEIFDIHGHLLRFIARCKYCEDESNEGKGKRKENTSRKGGHADEVGKREGEIADVARGLTKKINKRIIRRTIYTSLWHLNLLFCSTE